MFLRAITIVSFLVNASVFAEVAKKKTRTTWKPDNPLAYANATPVKPTATLSANSTPKTGLTGKAEFRPSYENGKWGGEYWLEPGVRITPKTTLSYVQLLQSNLGPSAAGGAGFGLLDGFLRLQANQIFENRTKDQAFSFESRVYFPTMQQKLENGMLTEVRSYFKYENKISDNFTLSLMEVPVFHAYTQHGFVNKDKLNEANPVLENRVYLAGLATFAKGKLNWWNHFMVQSTHFHEFGPGAVNDSNWQHAVIFYSELTYQVLPNMAVGAAFESSNLIAPDFMSVDVGGGINKGKSQLIFQLMF